MTDRDIERVVARVLHENGAPQGNSNGHGNGKRGVDRWIPVALFVAAQLMSGATAYIATTRNVGERIVVLEQQLRYMQEQIGDLKRDVRSLHAAPSRP